ncbi:MAG TPA: DnaA/Hda family protein [Planctomycetota bacterium]|nr:DnaA/Hda family protein [Planctomycetota bacterium]
MRRSPSPPRGEGTGAYPLTPRNRTAVLAARAAAANPGGLFNPLLLLGPPRSGKSRLLAALAVDLERRGLRPCLVGIRELGRRFVQAARGGRGEEFSRGLLRSGALLLDEVERLAGRERLSRATATLLEAFLSRRNPVAAACRIHPRRLRGFDPRLAGFLDGGFTTSIEEAPGRTTLEDLARDAAAAADVEVEALRGAGRSPRRAAARGAFVLASFGAGFSTPEIARFLGDRSLEAVAHLARRARVDAGRSALPAADSPPRGAMEG